MRNTQALLPCALALLGIAGCASLPVAMDKPFSVSWAQPGSTSIGKVVANSADKDHALSGIRLLASGQEAFASLIALADHAERSIDIQQYIITADDSSRALLRHVRAAADRGVRVRILVDDLNTAGEDRRFLHLSERNNIELRVFNPFPGGRLSLLTRFLSVANDMRRINHRMHNKLFVVDGAVAVTGGRNIGDQYFVRDKSTNFIDLDVLAAGAVVPQLAASFDRFWNSRFAYPLHALATTGESSSGATPITEPDITPAARFLDHEIDAGRLDLVWVPAVVLADRPAKIADEDGAPEETIANSISALLRTAHDEVTAISPYFVPGADGVALMGELTARAVRVRILTNSLATTDSPLVHIGYSRYRIALLKDGVQLYELRPKLGQKRIRFHPFKSSNASLHAKSLVIDHRTVFIGSMNMDARSARINSEMGLVIRSVALAHQVEALFEDVTDDGSYQLQLDPKGRLQWSANEDGKRHVWVKDPDTTLSKRLTLKLLTPFAPDELL
jgi:cardiolipin synthase C